MSEITQPADVALANALPELRAGERALRAMAGREGIAYMVAPFGGVRTQADTVRILQYRDADYALYVRAMNQQGKPPMAKERWRRIAPWGHSYHNYGAAFDVVIQAHPPTMGPVNALNHLKAMARSVGLRSEVPDDPPHFELPITLAQAAAKWTAQQGHGIVSNAEDKLSAILAAGIPGVQAAGASVLSSMRVTAARITPEQAAMTTASVVALGLLTWVVVRRLQDR